MNIEKIKQLINTNFRNKVSVKISYTFFGSRKEVKI